MLTLFGVCVQLALISTRLSDHPYFQERETLRSLRVRGEQHLYIYLIFFRFLRGCDESGSYDSCHRNYTCRVKTTLKRINGVVIARRSTGAPFCTRRQFLTYKLSACDPL